MSRIDALRPPGHLALYSLLVAGAFSWLLWLPYVTGWINADEFDAGMRVVLGLLAISWVVAALWAIAALLLRDEEER